MKKKRAMKKKKKRNAIAGTTKHIFILQEAWDVQWSVAPPHCPPGPYWAGILGQVSIPSKSASLGQFISTYNLKKKKKNDPSMHHLPHSSRQMRIEMTVEQEGLFSQLRNLIQDRRFIPIPLDFVLWAQLLLALSLPPNWDDAPW